MARPLRIEYPGAYYHVMNRGQSRRNIFIEDKGRQTFLDLLNWAVTRDRQNGWTRESVVGELGLFSDEGASGEGEPASAKSSED